MVYKVPFLHLSTAFGVGLQILEALPTDSPTSAPTSTLAIPPAPEPARLNIQTAPLSAHADMLPMPLRDWPQHHTHHDYYVDVLDYRRSGSSYNSIRPDDDNSFCLRIGSRRYWKEICRCNLLQHHRRPRVQLR